MNLEAALIAGDLCQCCPAGIQTELLSKQYNLFTEEAAQVIEIIRLLSREDNVILHVPEAAIMGKPRIEAIRIIIPDEDIQPGFLIAVSQKCVQLPAGFFIDRFILIGPHRMPGVDCFHDRHRDAPPRADSISEKHL